MPNYRVKWMSYTINELGRKLGYIQQICPISLHKRYLLLSLLAKLQKEALNTILSDNIFNGKERPLKILAFISNQIWQGIAETAQLLKILVYLFW